MVMTGITKGNSKIHVEKTLHMPGGLALNQLGDCSESVGEILLMEERNRANQLRLVVYPILLIRFFSSQVVSRICEPSAVAIVLGLCTRPIDASMHF